MSKDRKTRILIVGLVTMAVLTIMVFSILPENPVNDIASPVAGLFRPIERLFSGGAASISQFVQAVAHNRALEEENLNLREENVALRLQIKDNELAAQAYEKMKDAFNIKERFEKQRFVAANILQTPLDDDYSYYRLDVGTRDGLDWSKTAGFPVIDEKAQLLGRVVGADWMSSKMLAIYQKGFSAVAHSEKDANKFFQIEGKGMVNGQAQLMAVQIPQDCALEVGDKVLTSGKGGVFPEGLLCGTVASISKPDAFGMRKAAIVLPEDISQLRLAFILLPREALVDEGENGKPAAKDKDGPFPLTEEEP